MDAAERELALRAAGGDREALTRLYELHGGRLFGFLVGAASSRASAEDLFQEVWIKVMRRITDYNPDKGSFKAWLFRIAANAAVDRHRRESVRAAESLDAHDDDHAAPIERLVSSDPDPERMGRSAEIRRDIARQLGRLNEDQRTAILLRHQQGFSYQEIAHTLNVAEGTAKTMVHRGVQRLRRSLKEWTR